MQLMLLKARIILFLFLGIDNSIESEGRDRDLISLPGVQDDLAKALVSATKNLVVVLINGNAVSIEYVKNNVNGILEAFYPGENGGTAVVDALFGDCNPSGKLPYTIYPSDYVNVATMTNMNMGPDAKGYPGRTYRYYTGTPLWNFGFGLSYTNFTIDWNTTESEFVHHVDNFPTQLSYFATVTNTGSYAGSEVVMVYMEFNNNPDKENVRLVGYEKVQLDPKESKVVFVSIDTKWMQTVNQDGDSFIVPGTYKMLMTNGNDIKIRKTFKIVGDAPKLVHKFPRKN